MVSEKKSEAARWHSEAGRLWSELQPAREEADALRLEVLPDSPMRALVSRINCRLLFVCLFVCLFACGCVCLPLFSLARTSVAFGGA